MVAVRKTGDELNELTPRQIECLRLWAQGLEGREAARRLFIATSTFRTHSQDIYDKLQVRTAAGAVYKAMKLGILQ